MCAAQGLLTYVVLPFLACLFGSLWVMASTAVQSFILTVLEVVGLPDTTGAATPIPPTNEQFAEDTPAQATSTAGQEAASQEAAEQV